MKRRLNKVDTILTHIRQEFVDIFSADKSLDADPEVYTSLIKINNMAFEAKRELKELKKEFLQLQGEEVAQLGDDYAVKEPGGSELVRAKTNL